MYNLAMKVAIWSGLALCLASLSAAAADVGRGATVAAAWATVAASALNAREKPSTNAPVAFRIPRGTQVAIVKGLGQPTKIDGEEDTWTFVATEECANASCTRLKAGWVADSWLAYQERFEPMSEWRDGAIKGNDGERAFTYRISSDASFEFVTAPCRNADGTICVKYERFEGCHEEDFREGDECVGRGDLYRYKDLVWARGYGYLFVDEKGNLCSVHSGRNGAPRMCDR